VLLLALALPIAALADEGMWTLDKLPLGPLKDKYQFSPPPGWIDRIRDASVRLNSGCSGSFVSKDGLVMTNAHCALDCASQLSSKTDDLVGNGFLATDHGAEKACPGMEMNRLESITDVTAQVLAAGQGLSGNALISARNAVKAKIRSDCAGDSATTRCDVIELYGGARFDLYRYYRYSDVRLVFIPEYATAFFGGDPDNFNFPRFDFDVALLRAWENGKPAEVPAHFGFSPDGSRPGDLSFVAGNPGTTQRLLTVAQLERLRDTDLIQYLIDYSGRKGVLRQFASESPEHERVARDTITHIENTYKVLYGRLKALNSPQLMQAKQEEEAELKSAASAEQLKVWDELSRAQVRYGQLWLPYQLVEKQLGFWSDYYRMARDLVRAADERRKPDAERLPEYSDAGLERIKARLLAERPIYPELETAKLSWSLSRFRELLGTDDPLVKLVLGHESPEQLASRLVRETSLGDPAVRRKLWDGGDTAIAASTDPFILLARATDPAARAIRRQVEGEVDAIETRAADTIAGVRFKRFGTQIYPDATFSLRLSYGTVQGWEENGRNIEPYTTVAGLYQRATGAPPYALAPRWVKRKGALPTDLPFDFVTSNDIIGGNSGSPVLNRAGQIIGLVFDGNSHSLGGAYGYDGSQNRAVAVDSRAILKVLDAIYDAGPLVQEMTAPDGAANDDGANAAPAASPATPAGASATGAGTSVAPTTPAADEPPEGQTDAAPDAPAASAGAAEKVPTAAQTQTPPGQ